MNRYRPWGQLDWTLGLSIGKSWSFLGCLGSEERSVAAIIRLQRLGALSREQHLMLRIRDVNPQDAERENSLSEMREQQCRAAGMDLKLHTYGILDPMRDWLSCFDAIRTESVILDISSMPKRFFFPLLKRLLNCPDVLNLLMTYTTPSHYDAGPLSGDPEEWDILPGFRTDDPDTQNLAAKRLVVNVGFMPEGLLEHLGEDDPESTAHLLVPFPAPARIVRRTWAAVARLVGDPSHSSRHRIHRIAPQDLPEAFEKLLSLSNQNKFPLSLAPFGPKPISAAMCLFAAQTGMPVYYSQPKTYSPLYSDGIGQVLGYWIKSNGHNLYGI